MKEEIEKLGFSFEAIGHNDFELLGTFSDENGIEVNYYEDGTFGVPYGTEGNVMELKSARDLLLLKMLLTGEAYSEPEHILALKEAVNRKLNVAPNVQECDANGLNQGTEPMAQNLLSYFKEALDKEADKIQTSILQAGFVSGSDWAFDFLSPIIDKLKQELKRETECVEHMKEVCDNYEKDFEKLKEENNLLKQKHGH